MPPPPADRVAGRLPRRCRRPSPKSDPRRGDARAADPQRPARRRAGAARAAARRALEGRVRGPRAVGQRRRPDRRRDGRLGDRRAHRARDPRRPGLAAGADASASTGCRGGRRRTRPCSARATRARPRRRWPASRRPACIGARRVVATSGGTLAEQARAEGVPVIPVAGGLQPRAAVGYMTVAALEAAALCGAGPRMHTEIDVAAERLEQLVVAWGPDAGEESEAKALARSLHGTIPVIVGAGLTAPLAYRWKTQINENAKQHAFAARAARGRPQRDRRLVERRAPRPLQRRLPRGQRRHAARVAADRADARADRRAGRREPHVVGSRGQTTVERAFSLVLLGDLVSIYLAVLGGEDPTPVEPIERAQAATGSGLSAAPCPARGVVGGGRALRRSSSAAARAASSCGAIGAGPVDDAAARLPELVARLGARSRPRSPRTTAC